jgi:DNA-binding transcriptional ArsR family regulator
MAIPVIRMAVTRTVLGSPRLTITYSTEGIQTMARRMKGAGSVYERKDGYWVAQYKGQYRYAKTEKEARKKLLELIKAGEARKPDSKTTVAAFMDRWMTFAEQNLKPATVKRYKEAIEIHIKLSLSDKKLHQLDALSVQDMYATMQQDGLSPATVNLVHSVLSSAFKRAVKWGVLQHNIIENVEAPRILRKEVEVSHLKRYVRCSQQRQETVWKPSTCWH